MADTQVDSSLERSDVDDNDEFDDEDVDLSTLYLTFEVGQETYGLPIANVTEIAEYVAPTRVPLMPPCLAGVINLRGKVVPTIDLGTRFDGREREITRRTATVMTQIERDGQPIDIGVVVDAVCQVIEISADCVEPPPTFGATIRTDFIAGMGNVDERLLVLLDPNRVLSVEELGQVAGLPSVEP